MNLFRLSWRNIIHRPLASGLAVLLLAAGVSIILITLLTTSQLDEKFKNNVKDIDFVVGAKGSRLQLILCNIFQIDNPTGNISYAKANAIKMHPFVVRAIPLSIGDNYQTYRIVGTTSEYIDLYNGTMAEGRIWEEPMEAVIGSGIADKFHLEIGDKFAGGHGLGESTHIHDDMMYTVVGVLDPCNTVMDNLLLTSLESVWVVHAGEAHQAKGSLEIKTLDDLDSTAKDSLMTLEEFKAQDTMKVDDEVVEDIHDHAHEDHGKINYDSLLALLPPLEREITGMLIQVEEGGKPKLSVQGTINTYEGMMAADVAIEMQQLKEIMSPATGVMEMLAYVIMIIAAISMFVAMFNSLKDRQYEIALMRVMGSTSVKVFISILLEGLYLAILGFGLGWLLSHLGMQVFSDYLTEEYHYDFSGWIFLSEELYIFMGALVIGLVSAIYPAFKAYSTDISETLSKN